MMDLLNEEDFFPKEHNPKRWFNIFYALSLALSTICFWATRLFNNYLNEMIAIAIVITGLCMPLVLSLLMTFLKKYNILYLKTKKASYTIAILTLLSCCILQSVMLYSVFSEDKDISEIPMAFTGIVLVYLGIYLLTIAIVIPILKRVQRRNKLTQ